MHLKYLLFSLLPCDSFWNCVAQAVLGELVHSSINIVTPLHEKENKSLRHASVINAYKGLSFSNQIEAVIGLVLIQIYCWKLSVPLEVYFVLHC